MYDFTTLNRRQRIIQRNRTERLSDLLDWRNLGVYYKQARNKALKALFPDVDVDDDDTDSGYGGRFQYPKPYSEPPSPSSTSVRGSDDEDSVDEETEIAELNLKS